MNKGSIRNIVIGAVFVLALAIVLLRGESFFELIDTMSTGAAIPLILAFIIQMGKYVSQGFAYSSSFRTVEERLSPKTCFPLVFSAFFMNTVAPSLNTSGNLVFVERARQRGIGGGKATAAVILMQTSIEFGFMVVMIIGFIIIHLNGSLTPVIFIVGLWVVALVGLMGGSLILARKAPKRLVSILRPLELVANKFSKRFRKKPMNPWAIKAADALCEAAGEIARHPTVALRVFLLSVLASVFEFGCFYMVGIAFGVTDIAALLGGYVVAILFTMIAITPMGLGVVEAAIVVLLTSYGVSLPTATAVSLVFRGIVFWLPFAIGIVVFQVSHRLTKTSKGAKGRLFAGEHNTYASDDAANIKVGGGEVGFHEVDPREVDSREVSFHEVGPREVGPREVGSSGVGSGAVGSSGVGSSGIDANVANVNEAETNGEVTDNNADDNIC